MYSIILEGLLDEKYRTAVTKVVRECTGWSLADCVYFVDNPPGILKEWITKNAADDIKAKLEAAGAVVCLSPTRNEGYRVPT